MPVQNQLLRVIWKHLWASICPLKDPPESQSEEGLVTSLSGSPNVLWSHLHIQLELIVSM